MVISAVNLAEFFHREYNIRDQVSKLFGQIDRKWTYGESSGCRDKK